MHRFVRRSDGDAERQRGLRVEGDNHQVPRFCDTGDKGVRHAGIVSRRNRFCLQPTGKRGRGRIYRNYSVVVDRDKAGEPDLETRGLGRRAFPVSWRIRDKN
jgi:hypothetical protein